MASLAAVDGRLADSIPAIQSDIRSLIALAVMLVGLGVMSCFAWALSS